MKLIGLSVDFRREGAAVFPVDPHLHKLAVLYAEENLQFKVSLADFAKVFVVAEVDDNDVPVKVHALSCEAPVPDYPVVRFTDAKAGDVLFERMRASLEDRGWRGRPVFIRVEDREDKATRCPMWRKFLRKWRASKASRWQVTV